MSPDKEWVRMYGPEAAVRRRAQAGTTRPGGAAHPLASLAPVQRFQQIARRAGNTVARRYADDQAFTVPEHIERTLDAEAGRGAPLQHGARQQMEAAFGADLSTVRVHTDDRASQLNSDLSARAFTRGHDIYFAEGAYAPASGEGQRLLAHELTHVEQQREGAKLEVGAASDPAELEADAVADRVVQRISAGTIASLDSDVAQRNPQAGSEAEEEEEVQALRRQTERANPQRQGYV